MQKLQRNKAGEFRGRKRFRGRTVLPNGSPRAHQAKSTTAASAGFTCGDTAIRPLNSDSPKLGPFKVPAPTKRWHRKGIVGHVDA